MKCVPLPAWKLLKSHIWLICELFKERGCHHIKEIVTIRGAHQLLQTHQDFCWHKWMRYNSPTPASPEYFLAVVIWCRGKCKVRGCPGAVHVGWVSAAEALGREHTLSAGENWKPHKKTQQQFLHLPSEQELRARQSLGPARKDFSLSLQRALCFPHKIGLIWDPVNFSKEKNLLHQNIYYQCAQPWGVLSPSSESSNCS